MVRITFISLKPVGLETRNTYANKTFSVENSSQCKTIGAKLVNTINNNGLSCNEFKSVPQQLSKS